MKEYKVTVHDLGDTYWRSAETTLLHREEGPAIEYSDGAEVYYLEGDCYTKEHYKTEMNRRNGSCEGKVIEVDGKKYKLMEAS